MSTSSMNPMASLSGSAQSDIPTHPRIEMKPKAKYKKSKGFPPARKKVHGRESAQVVNY